MGVSKKIGTPKWINFIRENPIKVDDLGGTLFLETPIYIYKYYTWNPLMTPVLIGSWAFFWRVEVPK